MPSSQYGILAKNEALCAQRLEASLKRRCPYVRIVGACLLLTPDPDNCRERPQGMFQAG
jgi:hypothetical protein